MKKLTTLIFALALAIALSLTAHAAGEGFNAGLEIDRSVDGQISVTVANSSVLAEKRPTLTIPCDFAAAYVRFGGASIASSLDTGTAMISFTVAAGGTYVIYSGTEALSPNPPQEADTVPISGDENSVTASVTVENGTATVDIDGKSLAEVIGTEADTGDVTIDLTVLNKNISTAVLPADSASALAKAASDAANDMTGLTIKLDTGAVTLDAKALETAAAMGQDMSVSVIEVTKDALSAENKALAGDRPVIDVTILSGKTPVSGLNGGSVTVSVPYTPAAGEDTSCITVWYLSEGGKLEAYACKYKDGWLTFTLSHLSQYIIAYFPFTDVPAGQWYYGNVAYAYSAGLMDGVGGGRFDPESATSRAMLVTVLYRMEGKPAVTAANPFTDVAEGQWYTAAIIWAADNKIIDGYGGGRFGPYDTLTREQMTLILYNYAVYKGLNTTGGSYGGFSDASRVSSWADTAMKWAVGSGLVGGVGENHILPQGESNRAQIAAVLERYIRNFK